MTEEYTQEKLYNSKGAIIVLANLIKNPQLVKDKDFVLQTKDFVKTYHKIIFSAIHNLYVEGVREMDSITLDSYIKSYSQSWYELFTKNNGFEAISKMKELANINNYSYYYNNLKKFTLLRNLVENGISIEEFYDIEEKDVVKNNLFLNLSIKDIIDRINSKFISLKQEWNSSNKDTYKFDIGNGMRELKERYKQAPSIGYPFSLNVLNEVLRGMRKKKFMLRSGSTGSGKSRLAMADAVNLAIPYVYDIEKHCWVDNGTAESVLYISTELEKEEVQTCVLAYLSGVAEEKILDGLYEGNEEDRVDKAIELFEQSKFKVEYIADFDITDIETIIEENIIKYNTEYVFFDYIHTSPKLLASTTKATGMKLREDQILFLFGNALKTIANRYEIFISSSTQLNRSYKEESNLDTTALRGANSLGDKLDIGMISLPISIKEAEQMAELIESNVSFGKKMPNFSHTIYKNRGNKLKGIRIWTNTNFDNTREEFIIATTLDYKVIQLSERIIKLETDELALEVLDYLNDKNNKKPDILISKYKINIETINNENFIEKQESNIEEVINKNEEKQDSKFIIEKENLGLSDRIIKEHLKRNILDEVEEFTVDEFIGKFL